MDTPEMPEKNTNNGKSANSPGDSQELLWKHALQCVGDCVWEWDISTGKACFYGNYWKDLLGYEKEDIPDSDSEWISHVHPDDYQQTLDKLLKFLHGNSPALSIEHRLRCRDGSYKWVLGRGAIVARSHDGSPQRVIGTHRDISEEKALESKLRESEELMRSVYSQSPIGIEIFDSAGLLIDLNDSCLEIFGVDDKSSVLGFNIFKDPNIPRSAMLLIKKGKQAKYETVFDFDIVRAKNLYPTGNTGQRDLDVTINPLTRDGKISGYIALVQDITEQKTTQAETARSQRLESIGSLAGGIAHDFNNVITAILGNISYAKLVIDTNRTDSLDALANAEKACAEAGNIAHQLLTFSKGGAPVISTISLESLLRNTAKFALSGSSIKCHVNISPDLWPAIVDQSQITHAIQNLVQNAEQAMPKGGSITIEAANTVIPQSSPLPLSPGNYVRISIADTGTGIPHDILPRIFDPFFSTKQKARGLGLSTAYSIINKHKGYITVASRPAEGSSFTFYLPAASQARKQTATTEKHFPGRTCRILVMDDDPMIRTMLSRVLSREKHYVAEAPDGETTLNIFRDHAASGSHFDIAVLDMTIPGGLGALDIISSLIDINPNLRAVLSTGYSTKNIMNDHLEYGFAAILNKPYNASELKSVIDSLL